MRQNRFNWKILVLVCIVFVLAACGAKSKEDVAKDLEENLDKLTGYKAKAEMTMNTGQEEQKYLIDIWHQKDDNYRVRLSNDKDEDGGQIILKNKDGVFVLTPSLDKSFKFQTEWPENGSQPYLYQSLAKDIMSDADAAFEVTETDYKFRTKTNYQSNNNLPFQEIFLDKKSLTPNLVRILDKDDHVLVEVKFTSFELNPSFAKDDFSMEKNMAAKDALKPVSGPGTTEVLEVILPEFTAGAELVEQKDVILDNGKRVILTFDGEKNFTLVQERVGAIPAMNMPKEVKGDIVNLGNAVAALSNNKLEWSYEGVNYILASDELTQEEMIEVAQSLQSKAVQNQIVK